MCTLCIRYGITVKISSLQNETIKSLVKLKQKKGRDVSGSFLVEGEHLLQELKNSQLKFRTFGLDDSYDVEITEAIASKLSQTHSGSSMFAEVEIPQWQLNQGTRFVLCDGVQDPGNMGTIIRTAYSFGFDAVILSEDCVDIYNDKVVRSSQGAVFHMPSIRTSLPKVIDTLESMGVELYATHLSSSAQTLSSITMPKAIGFVLGSEGSGVSDLILERINQHCIIEMTQFESLNVAVAAAIICYQFRK